jgi:alanyl-tRNA synthetase
LHVQRTSQIQRFKILREEGVAAGTRRIEACSGEALVRYLLEKESTLDQAAHTLQVPSAQVPARISKILQEKNDLEKKIKELEKKLASGSSSASNSLETNFKGKKIIVHIMEDVSVNSLREVADQLRHKTADAAHVLVSGLNLIVTADPKLSFHSGAFLKEFVGHWKGRGGGNEKTAQGAFQEKITLDEIQNWFKSHAG